MRTVLFLILSLLLTPVHASVSTSAPTATDFSGQLDEFTDLLTVDAEGGSFRALRNSSLAPELLGGAVLLGDTLPGWITQTAALRTGLAGQGWDLLSAEPAEEAEVTRRRAQALIDSLREAGNRRILVIATGSQAANAIELVKESRDLRLVMFNASSNTQASEDIAAQIESLGRALTIELYTRSPIPSEASRRHIIAKKQRLATYRARPLIGPPLPTTEISKATTKRILGAIKTLIVEFEQQKS